MQTIEMKPLILAYAILIYLNTQYTLIHSFMTFEKKKKIKQIVLKSGKPFDTFESMDKPRSKTIALHMTSLILHYCK